MSNTQPASLIRVHSALTWAAYAGRLVSFTSYFYNSANVYEALRKSWSLERHIWDFQVLPPTVRQCAMFTCDDSRRDSKRNALLTRIRDLIKRNTVTNYKSDRGMLRSKV